MPARLNVTLLLQPHLSADAELLGMEMDRNVTPADLAHEFGGRACYQAFHKPNPSTEDNDTYLANIIRQGHTSVLEHASFSLYVTGVSRALLLELERHRHLSFSVLSQRFVDAHRTSYVVPPAIRDSRNAQLLERRLWEHFEDSLEAYDETYQMLRAEGRSIKEAREAARAFLPECTETRFVVSGNIRAWRHIFHMRDSEHADAEIAEFARAVKEIVRTIAPNSIQDLS